MEENAVLLQHAFAVTGRRVARILYSFMASFSGHRDEHSQAALLADAGIGLADQKQADSHPLTGSFPMKSPEAVSQAQLYSRDN